MVVRFLRNETHSVLDPKQQTQLPVAKEYLVDLFLSKLTLKTKIPLRDQQGCRVKPFLGKGVICELVSCGTTVTKSGLVIELTGPR